MLSSVIAMAMLQPAPAAQDVISYVIFASPAIEPRIQELVGAARERGLRLRSSEASATAYASCFSIWARLPAQAEQCIRAQLPSARSEPTIVLHGFRSAGPENYWIGRCVGPWSSASITLSLHGQASEAVRQLRSCANRGRDQRNASTPLGIRLASDRAVSASEAQLRSSRTVMIAIDHVAIPRPSRGTCWISGRLVQTLSGTTLSQDRSISFGLPCSAGREGQDDSWVSMADLSAGRFAELYLDADGALLFVAFTGPLGRRTTTD